MTELARGKRVYSAYMIRVVSAPADGLNIDEHPANIWTPPGDIKVIGARVSAQLNIGADADMSKTVAYHYAEVSILPKMGSPHQIAIAWAHLEVVELPTTGEHALIGNREATQLVMYPAGEGVSLNEWHPVYLNITYRNRFAALIIEMAANATIYYVEL